MAAMKAEHDALHIIMDTARIAAALVRRPHDVPRYVREGLRRTSALELGLPWFSYGAIDALNALVRPEWTVVEYGSGGSTLFFASKVARVITAEHDPLWAERVAEEGSRRGLSNIEVRTPAADFSNAENLLASPYGSVFDDLSPDLAVSDCWTDGAAHDGLRPALFRYVEVTYRPKIIVVDDSHRYPQLRDETCAERVLECWGVGPSRRRVTCTDLYLLRNR